MRPGGWWLHAVFGLVIVAELGIAAVRHRSDAELREAADSGSVEDRLEALHVLANRGEPDRSAFDRSFVAELLADPDDRIREFAFTSDVCKFELPTLQDEYLSGPVVDYPHWWRATVFHRRKVGGRIVGGAVGLRRVELDWYDAALRELAPPMAEVERHLRRIAEHSRRRQNALGIEPFREPMP